MTPKRRQILLLAILGVLLLWFGGRRLFDGVGDRVGFIGGGERGRQELPWVARLEVGALAPESGQFRPGRDIFSYGPLAPTAAERPQPQRPRTPPPPPPPPAPTGPQPPPVNLVYLGSFGPRSAPIAVLSDRNVIYNARRGDVIDERFIVQNIGFESVDLGFIGFPEDLTERLGVGPG